MSKNNKEDWAIILFLVTVCVVPIAIFLINICISNAEKDKMEYYLNEVSGLYKYEDNKENPNIIELNNDNTYKYTDTDNKEIDGTWKFSKGYSSIYLYSNDYNPLVINAVIGEFSIDLGNETLIYVEKDDYLFSIKKGSKFIKYA